MGWFILRDAENPALFSLWNPITRNSILLPELPEKTEPDTYLFTSPPYTGNCVFLLFCNGFVFSCRPTIDDCNWVKLRLKHDNNNVRIVKAAILNQEIYAYADLSGNTVFARLSISLNNNSDVVFEELSLKCPSSRIIYNVDHRKLHYLVQVCGIVYAVTIIPRQLDNIDGFDILKVFVWKLDLSKMDWIQVESIVGDCGILLGDNCCCWCCVDDFGGRIERNSVYMVNNLAGNTIHQYRLQDSSYTFLSSHTDFQSFSDGAICFMPYNTTRLPSLKEIIVEKIEDTFAKNSKQVNELKVMMAESPKSFLLQLPSEVLVSISNCLHWFDSLSLRATCKKLRSDIPIPRWKANSSMPLFMFLKTNEGICELLDPCCLNGVSIFKKLPYSTSIVSTIEFAKDGWLLLRSHEGCYLQYINLLTRESGEYPTESLDRGHSCFLFSTYPTSPDCLTVGVSSTGQITINFLPATDDKWHLALFDNDWDFEFQDNYNSSPKYLDGSFYVLDKNGNLGILEMEDQGCRWEVYMSAYRGPLQEDDEDTDLHECYVAELDGQPVYIFIRDVGSKVQVYTFDVRQEVWTELESLGDFILFLSSASSFSVAVTDSSFRNRIYLPKRIGNEMVFYSLDTRKYHTSSSNESYENFHGMISQSFSCWV